MLNQGDAVQGKYNFGSLHWPNNDCQKAFIFFLLLLLFPLCRRQLVTEYFPFWVH